MSGVVSLKENAAFALWRDESIRVATRPRTWEQWLDQSEETRDRWRRAAQAALEACQVEELASLLRRIVEWAGEGDNLNGDFAAARALLAKLEAGS